MALTGWLGGGAVTVAHARSFAAEATVTTLDAPVTAVTVFSDRARVTRTARLNVQGGAGGQRVQLPILMSSADPASIRVEAYGKGESDVAVQRVEINYVEASELPLPVGEAEKLLAELDRTDDQITQAQAEQAAYAAQQRLIGRILPSTAGLGQSAPGQAPPPRLNPTGWPAVFQFVRQLLERVHTRSREVDEQVRTLSRKRQELIEKAQKLGGLSRRSGYRVLATLSGSGAATVTLVYMATGARWLPTYDIQLQPAQNRVELSLAGLVSQETGEDWSDAALTLSTAVPATATQLPKLLAWKLGERERFIPTPAPQREGAPQPPSAPPLVQLAEADPSETLRLRLLHRLGLRDSPAGSESRITVVDERKDLKQGGLKSKPKREAEKTTSYDFDEDTVEGDLIRPDGEFIATRQMAPSAAPAAPPPPPPSPEPSPEEPVVMAEEMARSVPASSNQIRRLSSLSKSVSGYGAGSVVGVGLAPPPGYVPPRYDGTLPASLAGGYDLVFPGLSKDTVRSGQGARRVALLSRSFPVAVSRKITAALAPEAFLVAEIKNPGSEPLPGGRAHLFVGADPAGVAQLKLIAPGEVFTLPLGLDHAIRPVRNVKMTTIEKGVFSKDEISEYVVTTEVVNPYRVPIDLRLHDQIPLASDKNVEIQLVRSDPAAKLTDVKGELEWRLSLAPGGKLVTTFVYSLRRPKGYRLNQSQY